MNIKEKAKIKRCLILNCSKTKRSGVELMRAIERYDGPLFRVIRKSISNLDEPNLSVFILSAKFGAISAEDKIPAYDYCLSSSDIIKLRPEVLLYFNNICKKNKFDEIFFAVGKNYRKLINGVEENINSKTKLFYSKGGYGQQSADLKKWLYGDRRFDDYSIITKQKNHKITGKAQIKGITIQSSVEEIFKIAEEFIKKGEGNPYSFKNWYVKISEHQVGPKWLVSQLSGLPVGKFTSGEARRVLTQLGIEVISQ